MRKTGMLLMTAMLVVFLAACGTTKNTNNTPESNQGMDHGGEQSTENKDQENNAGNTDSTTNNAADGQLEHAKDVADKITELDEVERATVFLSENNAYVAVMLNDQTETENDVTHEEDDLTDALKDQIKEKVKEVKTDVNEVYISANPDFGERMRGFGTRIEEGEPIAGFFEEFGEAVRNVFPDAR